MNQITIKDLDSRFGDFRSAINKDLDARFKNFEAKVDLKFEAFETKIDYKFVAFETRIDRKFDDLALMINKGFKESHKDMFEATGRCASLEQHDALKTRVKRIERGLGIQSA